MNTQNKLLTVVGAVALVAAATTGGYSLFTDKSSATPTTSAPGSSATSTTTMNSATRPATTSSTATSIASTYKDGTYTATSSYSAPHGGQNTLAATVVIANGKISSVKTTDTYADDESAMWIGAFEQSVSSDASGQSIADYTPTRVGGASLTSMAFSDTLDQIRSKAAA